MLNKLFIGIILLLNLCVVGQSMDAVRLEVETDIDAEAFHVETIDKDGLMIFYASAEVDKEKKRKWYFGLFDTGLKQEWLKFIPLADKIEFLESRRIDNKIYLFFKNTGRDRSDYGYYEIVTYDIRKQDFEKISGAIPAKADYAGFEVIGNTACLALNLKKNETDLVLINLNNGELSPIHIEQGTPGYIESLYADRQNSKFYIAIKQNRDRRYIGEYLLSYSIAGKQMTSQKINNIEPLKYFKDYVFVKRNKNELLIFGTYNVVAGKNLAFKDLEEDIEERSAGIYYLRFVDDKQEWLVYYDFMEFNNISGAIGRNNFVTNKKSSNKDTSDGVNPTVSAAFNLNKPMIYRSSLDEYVFSVEVFQPYYKTETRMDYDFYGRPYPYTYNVFSGYNFYDVIVAGLSADGSLLWSNDFPIEDMLTFSTSRKSTVFSDGKFVSLAYVNNGNVDYQVIEGSSDIDRSKMKIGTDFPQDRISEEENSHIVPWYGDCFLIYGYQKIKNRTLGDKSTRVVFYANKIAYK